MQTTYLEKRSSENVRFDIDCSVFLGVNEVIQQILGITADTNGSTALTFSGSVINQLPVMYGTRSVAIGKVVQPTIGGGAVPATVKVQDYIVRIQLQTNINPILEATVRLRVNDTP